MMAPQGAVGMAPDTAAGSGRRGSQAPVWVAVALSLVALAVAASQAARERGAGAGEEMARLREESGVLQRRLAALDAAEVRRQQREADAVQLAIVPLKPASDSRVESTARTESGLVTTSFVRLAVPGVASASEIVSVETDCYDPDAGAELWAILRGWRLESGSLLLPERITEVGAGGQTISKSPLHGASQVRVWFRGRR
jgi:hypothetical protein